MVSLDSSNACCRHSSHLNGCDGLRRSRNGSMVVVMLKAYATWFTSPNHDRTSVRFFGVGKSLIARVNFWHGLTESAVISKPANSTLGDANWNFNGFRVMPCRPQRVSQLHAWWKLSSMVSAHRRVSSTHLVFCGTSDTISSYLLV